MWDKQEATVIIVKVTHYCYKNQAPLSHMYSYCICVTGFQAKTGTKNGNLQISLFSTDSSPVRFTELYELSHALAPHCN